MKFGAIVGFIVGAVFAAMMVNDVNMGPLADLNLPAFLAAAVLGGNVHSPPNVAIVIAAIVQWTFIGWGVGALGSFAKRRLTSMENHDA